MGKASPILRRDSQDGENDHAHIEHGKAGVLSCAASKRYFTMEIRDVNLELRDSDGSGQFQRFIWRLPPVFLAAVQGCYPLPGMKETSHEKNAAMQDKKGRHGTASLEERHST